MGLCPDGWKALKLALAAAGALLLAGVAQAETLTVCLDDGAPPYSFKRKSGTGGFDFVLAGALAERLGRTLELQWFESEYEREGRLSLDVNALLSAGKCDLVASYPLYAAALGLPPLPQAALPRHEGGQGGPRGPRIKLQTLIASRAYSASPLGLVLGKEVERPVSGLDDLEGLRIGARAGTLSGTILMSYRGGRYVKDVVSLRVMEDALPALAEGRFDATLVELHHFQDFARKHPEAGLKATDYRHPVVFNFGYATIEANRPLLEEVNAAIGEMLADGTIEKAAAEAGMTFYPPKPPEIIDRITPGMLAGG